MTSSRDRPSDHLGWVRWIGTVLVLLLCALAVLLGAGTNATTATTHAYDLAIKDASTHLAQAPATAERQPLPVELAATRAWEPSSIAPVVAAESEAAASGALEPMWALAPDNGFLGGWSTSESLQPGTAIDRYGGETGRFFSPEGTPFEARSLPAGSGPYNAYEVIKPLPVQGGIVAPAFGEPGLGVQYMASQTVADLIEGGFLKPVAP